MNTARDLARLALQAYRDGNYEMARQVWDVARLAAKTALIDSKCSQSLPG